MVWVACIGLVIALAVGALVVWYFVMSPGGEPERAAVLGSTPANNSPPAVRRHTVADRPDMEIDRENKEAAEPNQAKPVVESGFEGSRSLAYEALSPSHVRVAIDYPGEPNFPLIRLRGVAGRTVRIDLDEGERGALGYWSSLNPVYTDASSLSDPETFAATTPTKESSRAWNNAMLPSTDGQKWHYITNVWMENAHSLSFVETFKADSVYIATRVPYPVSYNQAFFNEVAKSVNVTVAHVGQSSEGRPLLMAEVGSEKNKPVVVIYAGEHADEPDGMWAAEGAVRFLTGDTDEARQARVRATYLIIPVLDPDATFANERQRMGGSFMTNRETAESVAYANWFAGWVASGQRIDVVFDLNNFQSGGFPEVTCAIMEGLAKRGQLAGVFSAKMQSDWAAAGFGISKGSLVRGWSPDRLGGWLARRFGPECFAYQLNCQAMNRHLNLWDLRSLGENMVKSSGSFLTSSDGATLMANVDDLRAQRLNRLAQHPEAMSSPDAIQGETAISQGEGISSETSGKAKEAVEKWFP